MKTMMVKCEACGRKFEREAWRVERSKHQFCCHPCYAVFIDRSLRVRCEHCGKTFRRKRSEVARNNRHFCSMACILGYKRANSETRACANCQKPVTRSAADMRKQMGNTGDFFCGKSCRQEFYQRENHPRWDGGAERLSYWHSGHTWKIQKAAALRRDRHACRACGTTEDKLAVHHIEYPENRDELTTEMLITLCARCHAKLHRDHPIQVTLGAM